MQKLLCAGLLASAALLPAAPAAAQYEGAWCLNANQGRSVTQICHFRTFDACANERLLYGTTSFCGQNPRYLPYWQGRGFGPAEPMKVVRKKHKKKHHS